MIRPALAPLAAVALLVAACGGGGDDGGALPTAATTAPPLSTQSAGANERAAVLAAYRAFWDAYLAAADPMDPADPRLAEVATGEELRQLRSGFLAMKSAGEVIRGSLDLAPQLLGLERSSATVKDCYLDRTGVYDAATGRRKDPEGEVRYLVTVRLVREDGRWKVASITKEGEGCMPASAS